MPTALTPEEQEHVKDDSCLTCNAIIRRLDARVAELERAADPLDQERHRPKVPDRSTVEEDAPAEGGKETARVVPSSAASSLVVLARERDALQAREARLRETLTRLFPFGQFPDAKWSVHVELKAGGKGVIVLSDEDKAAFTEPTG